MVLASAFHLTQPHRTLYESKGLEFNDVGPTFLHAYTVADETKVLLYNFFEDSTATSAQWRLVLNGVSNRGNLSDVPTFDETHHASICIEVCHLLHKFVSPLILPGLQLKFLYVAVTRARNNLWIVDGSESAEPMKVPDIGALSNSFSPLVQVYWSSKDQIQIWSSTKEIPHLAVSSTSEEWTKTGKT